MPTYSYAKTDGTQGTTTDQSNAPGIDPHSGFQAISSAALTPASPIALPPVPTPTNYNGAVANGNAVIGANAGTLTPPATDQTASSDPFTALFDKYGLNQPAAVSSSDIYNTDYAGSGIDAKQATVNEASSRKQAAQSKLNAVSAQLQGLTAEATAAQLQSEGRATTSFQVSGEQDAINRSRAIKAIPLQIQALAAQAEIASAQGDQELAQGILKQAQDHLDTVFQLHMADATAQYQYKKDTLDKVYQFATAQEQRKLDTIQHKADQDFQTQAATIANERDIQKIKLENQLKQSDPLYKAQLIKAQNEANASAPGAGYNGDFSATIDLAANTGGTNQQRSAIQKTLQSLIAAGDYKSAYAAIQQATASSLTGASKTDYQNRSSQLEVTKDLATALNQLKAAGYDTNKLTGGADAIGTKLGVLATNPQYAATANQLNLAFQNYRQAMTGAAFGAKESAEYASVLPGRGNTFALNEAKIAGLTNYLTSVSDSYTHQVVGDGGKYIREYAQGASPTSATTAAAPATLTAPLRLLAPAEIPVGYFQANDGLLYKK